MLLSYLKDAPQTGQIIQQSSHVIFHALLRNRYICLFAPSHHILLALAPLGLLSLRQVYLEILLPFFLQAPHAPHLLHQQAACFLGLLCRAVQPCLDLGLFLKSLICSLKINFTPQELDSMLVNYKGCVLFNPYQLN